MMPSALRSSERKAIPASMARHGDHAGREGYLRVLRFHRKWFGPEQSARRFASTRQQTRKPDDFAMPHFHRDAVEPVLIFESFRLQHWPTCRVLRPSRERRDSLLTSSGLRPSIYRRAPGD